MSTASRTRRRSSDAIAPDSPAWSGELRRRLIAWFRRAARDLPWRRDADPYRVWVSEIMLQQTTVAAVVPYFERFMARFPSVQALAAAPEGEVLRLWEGLGYYRRARQLHLAAAVIVAERGGRFPDDAESLLRLPGIGRYTAGAIASIAFDRREPILEANTLRVYSRLLGMRGDPRSAAGQARLWDAARSWLPKRGVGRFNQALMELGATICSPRAPDCSRCPVTIVCRARALGLQEQIPPAARRPAVEEVCAAAVVVRRGDRVLLVRRSEGERWAGLWDFLRFDWPSDEELQDTAGQASSGTPAWIAKTVREATGLRISELRSLTTLRHQVTRFRITLSVFESQTRQETLTLNADAARWVAIGDLSAFALSTTGRKIARLLSA